LVYAVPIQAVV